MKMNLSLLDRNLIKALALMLSLTSSIIYGLEIQVTEQETATTTYYYVDDDKIRVHPLYDRVAVRVQGSTPILFRIGPCQ